MSRFTQEYIEFIQSPEADILQHGHKIKIGEWRVLNPYYKDSRPFLVTTTGGRGVIHGRYEDESSDHWFYPYERSRWLPDIDDLCDMLIEAGWSPAMNHVRMDGDDLYEATAVAMGSLAGDVETRDESSGLLGGWRIAVATMAVAVLRQYDIDS